MLESVREFLSNSDHLLILLDYCVENNLQGIKSRSGGTLLCKLL